MIKIAYLDEEPGWQSLFYDKFSKKFDAVIPETLPRDVTDIWELVRDAQVIITDYRLNDDGMVNYTGDDVARIVHRHNKHLPIFIITSYEDNAIQSCRETLIIRGKEMFQQPESEEKLCHMIEAAVNRYDCQKASCETTIEKINEKLASGEKLSPEDEADRFDAELYLAELDLDSSVRANLIATNSSDVLKEMLETVRSISAKHK
jgi:hypothetical protein